MINRILCWLGIHRFTHMIDEYVENGVTFQDQQCYCGKTRRNRITMSETKGCETCGHNPDNAYVIVFDACCECESLSNWRELKRYNPEKCETCLYENDPCHCDCQDCQDAANWAPRPTLRDELLTQIKAHRQGIEKCKYLLKKISSKES